MRITLAAALIAEVVVAVAAVIGRRVEGDVARVEKWRA